MCKWWHTATPWTGWHSGGSDLSLGVIITRLCISMLKCQGPVRVAPPYPPCLPPPHTHTRGLEHARFIPTFWNANVTSQSTGLWWPCWHPSGLKQEGNAPGITGIRGGGAGRGGFVPVVRAAVNAGRGVGGGEAQTRYILYRKHSTFTFIQRIRAEPVRDTFPSRGVRGLAQGPNQPINDTRTTHINLNKSKNNTVNNGEKTNNREETNKQPINKQILK